GAASAAIGFGLVTIALAHVQQAVEVVLASGNGGGGQPAVVGGAVAGLEACTDVLVVLDDVAGIQRVIADRAADGAAAVQRRRRAAQDFHALDDFRVDVVAMGI